MNLYYNIKVNVKIKALGLPFDLDGLHAAMDTIESIEYETISEERKELHRVIVALLNLKERFPLLAKDDLGKLTVEEAVELSNNSEEIENIMLTCHSLGKDGKNLLRKVLGLN